MKLIKKYKNEYNNIIYKLYELNCGIKLIHLQNPASLDFDFAVISKAGSTYEDLEQVPHGSAHLLEHMFFRPNSTFKDDESIHQFEEGNRKKPAIYINGKTTHKLMFLTGHANEDGTDRTIERIGSLIEFPKEIFKQYFDIEKNIVLAEKTRAPKTEKDKFLQLLKFLEKDIYPEFIYPIVGEIEDIKAITLDDLEKYFKARFVRENIIFSVQSSIELSKNIVEKLENLGEKFKLGDSKKSRRAQLVNYLDFGSFYDERMDGTAIFLTYFEKEDKGFDYQNDASNNLLQRLVRKVGEEILRDKLGMIYSLNASFATDFCYDYIFKEIGFVIENHKLETVLEALHKFIYEDLEEFVNSQRGENWLEHVLSTFIYPHTIQYNEELAEEIVYSYLETDELYNANEYRSIAKKITKEDLLQKIKELQQVFSY